MTALRQLPVGKSVLPRQHSQPLGLSVSHGYTHRARTGKNTRTVTQSRPAPGSSPLLHGSMPQAKEQVQTKNT